MGIADGERVVSLDLDMVIIKELDSLFDRDEDFIGWRVPGGRHPRVFNGTIFMHRAATMDHVWHLFNPNKSPATAKHAGYFGTDQGWLSYLLSDSAVGWTREDGIMGFGTDISLTGKIPAWTRLISFHGRRKQWDDLIQRQNPWIKEYWK